MARTFRRGYNRGGYTKRKLLIAAAIAAFLIITAIALISGGLLRARISLVRLDVSSSASIECTKESLFALSGNTITSFDFGGNKNWNVKFESPTLDVSVSNKLICIYNDSTANVMGTDKSQLFSINPKDFQILRAKCSSSSIAFLTQNKKTTSIKVYSKDGSELQALDITDTSVLDFGFYGENDSLWVLTLDASGVHPASKLMTTNPAQDTMTGMLKLTDQVITDVWFNKDTVYLSGTTNLMYYNEYFTEKLGDILVYGLECVDMCEYQNDLFFFYAARNSKDGIDSLRILNKDSLDMTLHMPDEIIGAIASKGKIYCFAPDSVYLYDFSGKYISSMQFDYKINSVKKLSEDKALLYTKTAIYIMNLA